jgi:hypothetical protein
MRLCSFRKFAKSSDEPAAGAVSAVIEPLFIIDAPGLVRTSEQSWHRHAYIVFNI